MILGRTLRLTGVMAGRTNSFDFLGQLIVRTNSLVMNDKIKNKRTVDLGEWTQIEAYEERKRIGKIFRETQTKRKKVAKIKKSNAKKKSGKRNKRKGSVHTCSGGLPSLGKRR